MWIGSVPSDAPRITLIPRTTPREAKEWVGLINKHRSLTLEARDESAKRRHTGFSF